MKKNYSKIALIVALIIMIGLIGYLVYGYAKKLNNNTQNPVVTMEIKDYGTVKMELYPQMAPNTVTNFIKLAENGYYDGLTFHRIIEGFMMQGGQGPTTSKTIKGEFLANGIDNSISHTRGTISMARADAYDSGSTQFFIMHQDDTRLDNYYAAFGHVTKGIEVVDKICKKANPIDDNGTIKNEEQPIIEYIKVI